MEERLKDETLLQEEKKQKREKKQFYKNWKTYAVALGIIVIGTGTGLGIYYGVIANNVSDKNLTNQDFVNAINKIKYTTSIDKGSEATSITEQIDGDFIKEQLSNDFKAAFNNQSFKFNKVTVGDHDLNADDLSKAGSIEAKINYDYDSIKGSETSLTITVNEVFTDQDIVDGINNAGGYRIDVDKGSDPEAVTSQIDGDFIKYALSDGIRDFFNNDLFRFNKVTVDDHELNADDLKIRDKVNSQIYYDYGEVKNAEALLVIAVNETIDDKEISDNINQASYSITVDKGSEATEITKEINGDFIEKQLTGEVKELFESELFTFNQVTVGDHELNDDDLTEAVKLDAKINYDYDSIKNTETTLTITVNETITDKDISDSINQANYTIEVDKGSKATEITKEINGDFIEKQLTGEVKELFESELFTFNQVTVGDHELNDDDLTEVGQVNAKINYDYDSIKGSETSLTIDIQGEKTLEEAIKVKEVEGNKANSELVIIDEVINLNQDSGVTKEDLEVKSFDSASLTNPGKAILTATSESNFTGDVEIKITQLTEPTDRELIDAFSKAFNYWPEDIRKIPDGMTAEDLISESKNFTNVIAALAIGIITNWGWGDFFDIDKLKLYEITIDGREVTDEDLVRKSDDDDKYVNLDIRFDYGDLKDENLTAILLKWVKN